VILEKYYEMGNIRSTIQSFDETEKVVHTMDTLGGSQQVTFLTEKVPIKFFSNQETNRRNISKFNMNTSSRNSFKGIL